MGLLLDRGSFASAVLDIDYRPIVTLSNGDVFSFAESLRSWVRTTDDSFVHSELYSLFDHNGTINRTPAALSRLTMEERSMATLAHAEHEVATADLLADGAAYKKWMLMLCRQLVMYARDTHPIYRERLEEQCCQLMGPGNQGEDSKWDPYAAGHKVCKRSLLQELLPIIGTNASLHKLTAELHEYLQSV